MTIDPQNEWLFYVECGKRKFRGRWYLLVAGLIHAASWIVVYLAMKG